MTVEERLDTRCETTAGPLPTPCLLWRGALNEDGYGKIKVDGRALLVHRLAYALSHGDIPKGLVVRHACDVRNCRAEDHLVRGTHLDNLNDRRARGRWRVDGSDYARFKRRKERRALCERLRTDGHLILFAEYA